MKRSIAIAIAWDLLKEHGLNDWDFYFDKARRRAGRCNYAGKMITLSSYFVDMNEYDVVRDTILHEIAHALVGQGHGHSKTWKVKALEIGCDGQRCYGNEVEMPRGKFIGTCPGCGRQIIRHRRRKIACGKCCRAFNEGKYDAKYVFRWEVE